MENKNGFTLIELLAIIVILSIIAVITVPVVLNIIDDSKKGSAKDSAYGYIESVNRLYLSNSLDGSDGEIDNGYYSVSELKTMGVNVQGDDPALYSWIKISDNEVAMGCLQFGEYKIDISKGKVDHIIKGKCNGLPSEPVAFETDSWETIKRAIDEDNTSLYNVGDIKEVEIDGVSYKIRLINKSTPAECNTQGFSQSACGYVFEFVDFIGVLRINPTRTNVGGWPGSELYDYVNTDFYSKLPFELQNNIAETYVVSGHGSKPGEENFESIDKLYLLSRNELLGDYSEGDTSSGYTRQLDYYASGDSTLSKSRDWWLRSIYCCNNDSMYLFNVVSVSNSGTSVLNTYADFVEGISPAFRIVKD